MLAAVWTEWESLQWRISMSVRRAVRALSLLLFCFVRSFGWRCTERESLRFAKKAWLSRSRFHALSLFRHTGSENFFSPKESQKTCCFCAFAPVKPERVNRSQLGCHDDDHVLLHASHLTCDSREIDRFPPVWLHHRQRTSLVFKQIKNATYYWTVPSLVLSLMFAEIVRRCKWGCLSVC